MKWTKITACGWLVLFGCLWPFAMHSLAMHRLAMRFAHEPRLWLAWEIFVTILPTPAIIYSGFWLYLRDEAPFPANTKIAIIGSSAVFLITSIVYLLIVGGIGFQVPI